MDPFAGILVGLAVTGWIAVLDRGRPTAPLVAAVAVLALAPLGLRRDIETLATCGLAAVPLTVMLVVVGRQFRVGVVGVLLVASVAAAALATPDTEGPLLLAALLIAPAVGAVVSDRTERLTYVGAGLFGLAWALAMAHGTGGRPSSLVGAVAAWGVLAGLALAAPWCRRCPPVPAAVAIAMQLAIAPWLARLVGLRGEWSAPIRDAAVVWAALVVSSVLVRRAGRYTDDGVARLDVGGDHRTGTDHDVVADMASG
ncbi:MAG: hypothetical protein ACR2QE_11855 [Acidimicrobiales bacterium]